MVLEQTLAHSQSQPHALLRRVSAVHANEALFPSLLCFRVGANTSSSSPWQHSTTRPSLHRRRISSKDGWQKVMGSAGTISTVFGRRGQTLRTTDSLSQRHLGELNLTKSLFLHTILSLKTGYGFYRLQKYFFFSQAVSLPGRKLIFMSSNESFSSALNWKSKVVEMHRNEDLRAFRKTLSESANIFFPQQNQRNKSSGLIINSQKPKRP